MLLPTAAAPAARLRPAVAWTRALVSQARAQQQQQPHQQQHEQQHLGSNGAAAAVALAGALAAAAAAAASGSSSSHDQQQQQPRPIPLHAALAQALLPKAAADARRRPELARSREGDADQPPEAAARADAAMQANAAALRAARLREWLRRSGADLAAVELAPSPALLKKASAVEEAQEEKSAAAAGYGVLAGSGLRGRMRAPWLGRRLGAALLPADGRAVVAARVPLRLAITPESVALDPVLGPHVRELAELGLVDGRTAVILALCVHRASGGSSPLSAWVDALPTNFDGSPLWWATARGAQEEEEEEAHLASRLQELRGTSLAAAAAAHQRRLAGQWQRLRPAAEAMARDAAAAAEGGGGPSPPRAPTFDDYRWAYAVYWSRAHSLPVPVVTTTTTRQDQEGGEGAGEEVAAGEEQQQGEAAATAAAAAAAAATSGGGPKDQRAQKRQEVRIVEGLVPGLDFCNHSLDANAWWEVVPAAAAAGMGNGARAAEGDGSGGDGDDGASDRSDGGSVLLLAHRARLPKPGGELFISYGDKSNEELLLLHGFAAENNPHDAAMLPCPLPGGGGGGGGGGAGPGTADDGGWDEVLRARLELLHGMGLAPQLFLTAAHLRELEQDQRRLGWELAASDDPSSSSSSSSAPPPAPRRRQPSSSSPSSSDPATWRLSSARVRALPPGGRETLEAFVVPPEEVAERLRLLDELGPAGAEQASRAAVAAASDPSAPATARVEALGWAMATLTTFVRLLELRVLALESEDEGTGALERDLDMLVIEAGGGGGGGGGGGKNPPLEPWRRACVLYRAGQKRLVRGYLRAARAELQATLAELREAIDAEEREQQERERQEQRGVAGGGNDGAGGA
jgi:hypothetical protein